MATVPVLRFHDGKLEVPEELQRDWKLREGSELRVVSSTSARILLETSDQAARRARADWESLRGAIPDVRTPDWEAQAVARKERAKKRLDEVYASGAASTTELREAEREWELADDELDFGPFAKP